MTTSRRLRAFHRAAFLALGVALVCGVAAAGQLDPPGPPAPTMKTLDEVGPCYPVEWLPTSPSGVHVINAPGSYCLTGELAGVPGKNGIEINTDGVVLDLGGFTLRGVPGSWNGVAAMGAVRNIVVRNGVVRDWDQGGVVVDSESALLSELVALGNEEAGLRIWGGTIVNCSAHANSIGIWIEDGVVANSTVRDCWHAGIRVSARGLVEGCAARNCAIGIDVEAGDTQVVDSHIDSCGVGVRVRYDSLVAACEFVRNGWGVQVLEDGHGNRIEGNNFGEGNCGVRIDPDGYGNIVIGNTVSQAGTAAFDMPPGNAWGPIIDVSAGGDLSGYSGADHPWANFIF